MVETPPLYTLINASPSPYGRKIAIMMHEKGIPFEVRWEKPWEPTTIVGDYSPLQQLPILLEGSSEKAVAYDSTYIMEYIEIMHPEKPMLPTKAEDILLEKKIQMLAERLMEVTQIIFFEVQRPEETQSKPWLDRQTKKIETGLAALEDLISGKTPPSSEDAITVGDVALGSTLTIFEFEGAGMPILPVFGFRETYAKLAQYLDVLAARPSFKATVPVMFDTDLKKTV